MKRNLCKHYIWNYYSSKKKHSSDSKKKNYSNSKKKHKSQSKKKDNYLDVKPHKSSQFNTKGIKEYNFPKREIIVEKINDSNSSLFSE